MKPHTESKVPTALESDRAGETGGNAGLPGTRSGRTNGTEDQMLYGIGDMVRWVRGDNLSGAFSDPPAELSGTVGTIEIPLTEGVDFDAEVGQMYAVRFEGIIIHAFEDELTAVQT